MDIKTILTHELNSDLADSLADIVICKKALAIGVTEYSGGSVQERLEVNEKIVVSIRKELERRGES